MKEKWLFFDVDGTIVTAEHHIPESARRALFRARELGHHLIVNTGRPYLHVEPQIKALPFQGFICSLGGYILYRGEKLRHIRFYPEESRAIRDLALDCGMYTFYESEKNACCDVKNTSPFALMECEWMKKIGVPLETDVFREDFSFDKFVCWPGNNADPERFCRELSDKLDFIHRENRMLEAVRKGYTKGTGIRFFCEMLNIPRKNTISFGDGANDVDMLRETGTGVLLGNAPEEIWNEADFVSTPVWEDGLAHAMEQLGLLDK